MSRSERWEEIYFTDAAEYQSSPQLQETRVANTKTPQRSYGEVNKQVRHRVMTIVLNPKDQAGGGAKRENIKP